MTRDTILKSLVGETIVYLESTDTLESVSDVLTSQINRALDIGTNYLKFSHSNSKPIEKIDMIGNVINSYESIRQAARKNRIGKSSIIRVLQGKQATTNKGKFGWRYKI
jgi:S-adenosylmethionine:diacylglycerol 3-amino-3-carboxypropyl transferase